MNRAARLSLFVGVLATLPLGACGDESSETPQSLERGARRLAEELCALQQECDPTFSDTWESIRACEEDYTDHYSQAHFEGNIPGGEDSQACLDAVGSVFRCWTDYFGSLDCAADAEPDAACERAQDAADGACGDPSRG